MRLIELHLISSKAPCERLMAKADCAPPLIPRSAVIIRGENDGRVGWGVFY